MYLDSRTRMEFGKGGRNKGKLLELVLELDTDGYGRCTRVASS